MQNESINVTFSIKQKEYGTYCRNVMILYVAQTKWKLGHDLYFVHSNNPP